MATDAEYEDVEYGFFAREESEEYPNVPHTGHWSLFGTYWCDTCNSPYCELA